MSRICPACQASVTPRSRFCAACGAALPDDNTTMSMSAAAAHALAETAASPAPAATAPAASPGIGRAEAVAPLSSPEPEAMPIAARGDDRLVGSVPASSPLPVATPMSGENDACPVKVELLYLHLLVAGHPTTLKLQITNEDASPMEDIQLELESTGLSHPITIGWRRIAAGLSVNKIVEVQPSRAGNFVLKVSVSWNARGQRFSYRGQRGLKVLQAPETGPINIRIGDIQGNTGGGANANLGAEYGDVNISNLLGGIKTLNDLIDLDLPEKFLPVPLDLDYELSVRVINDQRSQGERALRIPSELLATAKAGSVCQLEPIQGDALPVPFRFVARPDFRLGRTPTGADFIARVFPLDATNTERSMRVSATHVIAAKSPAGLVLRDNKSSNGSTLDDQKLDHGGIPLPTRGRLVLGGTVEVDIAVFDSGRKSIPSISNLRSWSGPNPSQDTGRGAVRCEVVSSEPQPLNALWILSDASFGTSRSNAVVLNWEDLAEIQGRIHHFRGCFWVENVTEAGLVRVDNLTLGPGDIAPLATGQVLRLGSRLFRVKVEPS